MESSDWELRLLAGEWECTTKEPWHLPMLASWEGLS